MLAADIATRPGHDSFETLRILGEADEPAPWQPRRAGFTWARRPSRCVCPGHAESERRSAARCWATISNGDDGLARVLAALPPAAPRWCSRRARAPPPRTAPSWTRSARASPPTFPSRAPCTTSVTRWARPACCPPRSPRCCARRIPRRAGDAGRACRRRPPAGDGRRRRAAQRRRLPRARRARARAPTDRRGASMRPFSLAWQRPAAPPPLRDPLLRKLVVRGPRHRPAAPPSLLLVRLEAPLCRRPTRRSVVGCCRAASWR